MSELIYITETRSSALRPRASRPALGLAFDIIIMPPFRCLTRRFRQDRFPRRPALALMTMEQGSDHLAFFVKFVFLFAISVSGSIIPPTDGCYGTGTLRLAIPPASSYSVDWVPDWGDLALANQTDRGLEATPEGVRVLEPDHVKVASRVGAVSNAVTPG